MTARDGPLAVNRPNPDGACSARARLNSIREAQYNWLLSTERTVMSISARNKVCGQGMPATRSSALKGVSNKDTMPL
ncbi:hypothetical protein D3C71_1977600 [compost metagenome]